MGAWPGQRYLLCGGNCSWFAVSSYAVFILIGAVVAPSVVVSGQGGPCRPGTTRCLGFCHWPIFYWGNPLHCGRCHNSCLMGEGPGPLCRAGQCGCSPGGLSFLPGQTLCQVRGRRTCVNLKTSGEHCGRCNRGCAAGQRCLQGSCTTVGECHGLFSHWLLCSVRDCLL